MKRQTKRALLSLALIAMISYSVAGYFGYVPFPFQYNPNPEPTGDYKTVDVYGKVVNQQGNAIGATSSVSLYDSLGVNGLPAVSALASDTCDAAGEFILLSVPSAKDYYIYIVESTPDLYWKVLATIHVDGVLKTSEETSVRFNTPFVLPLQATTYTEAIESGAVVNSRTQAAGAMTSPTDYSVVAGVDTEFTFKTTVGTYSTRGYEWSLPRYSNINLHGVWMICTNMTFQVSYCPYTYETYSAAGVANYTLVFNALPASADDTSETVSQTIKLKWATSTGTPSFEVYFLWNTTVSALKGALTMGGTTGVHLTAAGVAAPVPGYAAGLFQVTDGTSCQVVTT